MTQLIKFLLIFLIVTSCGPRTIRSSSTSVTATTSTIDLSVLAGTWYEIGGHTPTTQDGCVGTEVIYEKVSDTELSFEHRCHINEWNGPLKTYSGKIWSTEKGSSEMTIQYLWPFEHDYWILLYNSAYPYFVVGDPEGLYVWILTNDRAMPDDDYETIIQALEALGYDNRMIRKTIQKNTGQ